MQNSGDFQSIKSVALRYQDALAAAAPGDVAGVLDAFTGPGYHCYAVHPFGLMEGTEAVANTL